ncbi:MAG: hypothetical protein ACAI25_11460 [Planctomycetota bacterium]
MKQSKPFGLEFLSEVDQKQVNGGRRRKPKPGHKPGNPGGPIYTTMAFSMPSAQHPQGDSF